MRHIMKKQKSKLKHLKMLLWLIKQESACLMIVFGQKKMYKEYIKKNCCRNVSILECDFFFSLAFQFMGIPDADQPEQCDVIVTFSGSSWFHNDM